MTISDTEHLSQLSIEEIKAVHKQWPNPLSIIAVIPAIMIGAGAFIMYDLENKTEMELIGALAAALIAMFVFLIYVFAKLGKAKKLLKAYAEARSLPPKQVIKEFQKQYPKMARELKKA